MIKIINVLVTYLLTGANLALDAVDTKSIQKLNQLPYKFAKLFSFVGEKSLFCTWLCILAIICRQEAKVSE